jgi:uncharacterized protein
MNSEIPIFALGTVLFPGGVLSLRVFETRYVDMVRECMRNSSPFGVACIRDGREIGTAALTHDIATTARIVDFDRLEDGLLGITAVGDERFQILDTRVQADQLVVATKITALAADPELEVPEELGHLLRIVTEIHNASDRELPDTQVMHAAWVANRIAEVLPIAAGKKHDLMALDDPMQRLHQVNAVVMELAQRE